MSDPVETREVDDVSHVSQDVNGDGLSVKEDETKQGEHNSRSRSEVLREASLSSQNGVAFESKPSEDRSPPLDMDVNDQTVNQEAVVTETEDTVRGSSERHREIDQKQERRDAKGNEEQSIGSNNADAEAEQNVSEAENAVGDQDSPPEGNVVVNDHQSDPKVPPKPLNGSAPNRSETSSLQPESLQHRHNADKDKPSSYQPSAPSKFFHLKALALQLPSHSSSSQQSSSHHIDPPTLILEGRTNLSTARRSFYPRVTRTLPELQLWILTLTLSFPAGIFSPFSYPSSSLVSGGSTEDAAIRSYLVTVSNQLARILRKPYVLSHPATVALVDCDFSYNPGMPHVGPGSSATARRKLEDGVSLARMGHDPLRGRKGKSGTGPSATATWDVDGVAAALGLPTLPTQASNDTYGPQHASPSNKGPLSLFSRANASPQRIQPVPSVPIPPGEEDQDEEELTAARNEITRLELQFEKASRAAHFFVERSGAMTATLHQLSMAMTDLARLDEGRSVARKARQSEDVSILTKGIESWSAAQAGANAALLSTVVPSMTYQSLNARAAIDALLRRAAAATHRHSALVVLVQKRREAERLKRARGEIRQEDVDWVLQELRDAQRTTQVLTHHLSTFTTTLKEELKEHSRNTHTDIQTSLLQHARSSIRAQKFMLNNLIRARDGLVALREGRSAEKPVETKSNEGTLPSSAPSPAQIEDSTPIAIDDARTATENEKAKGQPNTANDESSDDEKPSPLPKEDTFSKSTSKGVPEPAIVDTFSPAGEAEDKASPREDQNDLESGNILAKSASANLPVSPSAQQEPSPWAASVASPVAWKEVPPSSAAEPSPWAQTPPAPLADGGVEPSPWAVSNESAMLPSTSPLTGNAGFGTQSTFLPTRPNNGFADDDENPFGSTTANETSSPSGHPSMSQSAFLPGRDMSRYANPFARMDGGASSNPFATMPGGGSGGQGRIPRSAFGPEAGKTQTDRPAQGLPANAVDGSSGKPQSDPWANRSRISASDAARSLGGRF